MAKQKCTLKRRHESGPPVTRAATSNSIFGKQVSAARRTFVHVAYYIGLRGNRAPLNIEPGSFNIIHSLELVEHRRHKHRPLGDVRGRIGTEASRSKR